MLRELGDEAARLRRMLGFPPEPGRPANAIDLFAMPELLSPAGEELRDDALAQIERDRERSEAQPSAQGRGAARGAP